jgi:hypothetical protein
VSLLCFLGNGGEGDRQDGDGHDPPDEIHRGAETLRPGLLVLKAYEGKAGSTTLKTQKGGETFTFDANYWGDGRTNWRCIWRSNTRPRGSSNCLFLRQHGITVSNCGAGSYKPRSPN